MGIHLTTTLPQDQLAPQDGFWIYPGLMQAPQWHPIFMLFSNSSLAIVLITGSFTRSSLRLSDNTWVIKTKIILNPYIFHNFSPMTRSRSMNYTNDSYEYRAPYAAAAASLMANSYTMGESSTSRPYSTRPSSYYCKHQITKTI